MLLITSFVYLILSVNLSFAYKPVFIIHGVLSRNVSMIPLAKRIKEVHPGTKVFISDRYGGWASLEPMWRQTLLFGQDLMNISNKYPDGIHLIGYSQGGLVSRAVLESFSEHNVHSFISLSSPQAGQYGTKFLRLFFPDLVRDTAYQLFYSLPGQLTSVGNYWNDPYHQQLFFNYSAFLPKLNNEINHRNLTRFKEGIMKLKNFVCIGGPDDGVITPWQSSLFGYYNETVDDIDNIHDRDIYKSDLLGLKFLDDNNRLKLISVPGVQHIFWRKNNSVIDNYIIPYLN